MDNLTREILTDRPPLLAVDTETTGLDPLQDKILGLSLAWRSPWGEIRSRYIPVGHRPSLWETSEPADQVSALLGVLEREVPCLCYHSAPFDVRFLRQIRPTWELGGKYVDTYTLARVLAAEAITEWGLGLSLVNLYKEHCLGKGSISQVSYLRQEAKKTSRAKMKDLLPSEIDEYACLDAVMTLELAETLIARYQEDEDASHLWKPERDFESLLMRMEDYGILVDLEYIEHSLEVFQSRQKEIEKILSANGLHRLGSSVEEAKYLFDALGMRSSSTTLSGHRSVAREVLSGMKHPDVALILEWRQLGKAVGSWLVPIRDRTDSNGRIHGEWNVAGTKSGRISCSNPNLQAMPFSERGLTYGSLSGIFRAPQGGHLISIDYKQADLRLATLVAKEHAMARVFASGEDPYMGMAELVFGERNSENRQLAKRFSLATINAIGAATAAKRFEISLDQAMRALRGHRNAFSAFVSVGRFFEKVIVQRGYVNLWTGRRLKLHPSEETHKAFSRVVQGGVAEMVKWAMLEIDEKLRSDCRESRIVAQVHDSIVLEVAQNEMEIVPMAETIMRSVLPEGMRNRTDPPVVFETDTGPWATREIEVEEDEVD